MNHLSLFSGIGGLDLAAQWAGFRTVAFVERDEFCRAVIARHWPGVPIFGDVREFRGSDIIEPVAIVSGGFPCQPHSLAGSRLASADDRDLWPEFARVVREIRPRWFIAENVRGLLNSESGRFMGRLLGDMVGMGYRCGWGCWGANDVGAWHQRDRVFIVGFCAAHSDADSERRAFVGLAKYGVEPGACGNEPDRLGARRWRDGPTWDADADGRCWSTEPAVCRMANGIPGRMDRLKSLGNAVVPQQAFPLFAEIARIERERMTS